MARVPRYYEALGRNCDAIVRCKDCRAIVTTARLRELGCCPCGNKRFAEINILTEEEQAQIASGAIDFPDREAFLAEFTGVA